MGQQLVLYHVNKRDLHQPRHHTCLSRSCACVSLVNTLHTYDRGGASEVHSIDHSENWVEWVNLAGPGKRGTFEMIFDFHLAQGEARNFGWTFRREHAVR
jgi:hypothetical protein